MQGKPNVHHVAFVYRPENFEKVCDRLAKLLDIEWDGPIEMEDFGIRLCVSFDAGLEILAPLSEDNALWQVLEESGEGFHSFVYGVRDLDDAIAKAKALGALPFEDDQGNAIVIDALTVRDGEPNHPSWKHRLKVAKEAMLAPDPVCGLRITLGQFEPVTADGKA